MRPTVLALLLLCLTWDLTDPLVGAAAMETVQAPREQRAPGASLAMPATPMQPTAPIAFAAAVPRAHVPPPIPVSIAAVARQPRGLVTDGAAADPDHH